MSRGEGGLEGRGDLEDLEGQRGGRRGEGREGPEGHGLEGRGGRGLEGHGRRAGHGRLWGLGCRAGRAGHDRGGLAGLECRGCRAGQDQDRVPDLRDRVRGGGEVGASRLADRCSDS
jgi:hypothetical protein